MKFIQNLFQTVTNNPINSKTALEKKYPRRSNLGGGSRVGMTAVKDSFYFFYAFPNSVLVYCFTDLLDNWFTTGVLLVLNVNCANTVNL